MNARGWAFEPSAQDYGLDGKVEAFEGERATGVIFFVQLKATDETDLRKALTYSAEFDHLRYWASIGTPVLLVRYVAATRQTFVRWVSAFEEPRDAAPDQKTVTLHFTGADELTETAGFERLTEGLRLHRWLNAPVMRFKLGVRVDLSDNLPHRRELLAEFATAFRASPDFYPVGSGHVFQLRVLPSQVVVEVPHVYRRAVPLPAPLDAEAAAHLPYDAFAFIGLALGDFGRAREAGRVALNVVHRSAALLAPNALHWLSQGVVEARLWEEVLAAARRCLQVGELDRVQYVLATLLPLVHDAADPQMDDLVQLLRDAIAAARARPDPGLAAGASFSLANMLRVSGRFPEAHQALLEASHLEEEYPRQYHWQLELGRISFHLQRFEASAAAYREAERLLEDLPELAGQAHHALLLAADSLLKAGRYEEASGLFAGVLADHTYVAEEFHLKAWLTRFLISEGFTEQQRQGLAAWQMLQEIPEPPVADEVTETRVEGSLKQDALNPRAWHVRGFLVMPRDDEKAGWYFLAAAVLAPENLGAVIQALLTLLNAPDDQERAFLHACLLAVGFIHHQDALRSTLEDVVSSTLPEVDVTPLREMLDFIAHMYQLQERRFQMMDTPTGVTTAPWTRPPLILNPDAP